MLSIWVDPVEAESSKSLSGRSVPAVLEKIDPQELNASLKKLASDLETVFNGVTTTGGYSLDQIEVGIEVTVEAGINLIGTAKAGGKAAFTLSFSKKP
jgi:hypothetical protein